MKYTDNQNELFDIVDEDDQVIGQATRGEVHRNKNLIHRSIGVCVFNSKGEIYLQKRSSTKDTDPGKWTISCSGHVGTSVVIASAESAEVSLLFCAPPKLVPLSGTRGRGRAQKASLPADSRLLSEYEKAAHRELLEELGVDLKIEFVEKYICRSPKETEMQILYKAYSNGPFKLQPQEIEEGKFYTQKELKEAIKRGEILLSFSGRMSLEKIGWYVNKKIHTNEQC